MSKQKLGITCRHCNESIELTNTSVALIFSVACPYCFERGYYEARAVRPLANDHAAHSPGDRRPFGLKTVLRSA